MADTNERTLTKYRLHDFDQDRAAGKYQIPTLKANNKIPDDLLAFKYAMHEARRNCGVHFFMFDWEFERIWERPSIYMPLLSQFQCVLTPDFSLYTDMPLAMKIWNVYRSRMIGQMMQDYGIEVIPTLQWAEEDTFEFVFDGLPKHATYAVSTVGVMTDKTAVKIWERSMQEAIRRLEPETILLYGKPIDFDFGCKVIEYAPHRPMDRPNVLRNPEKMRDFQSVSKTVEGNEGEKCKHRTRLDTYGCGCSHDCSYCYAKSLLDFRNLWNPKSPSVGDISEISKAIKKLPTDQVVRLGGMTDCFQPIEKLYRVTYKTIRLLNRRRIPYLIVTKSALVGEYTDILDKDLAHIQVTVTTLDDELCATYEKASPPSERIKAIKKLQDLGYDVQLRLSPYIPEYVDTEKLNGLGVDKICVEFLRVNTWIRKWFDIDYSEYTVKQGGYSHLPLEKKVEYLSKITGFKEVTVCEDEDRAYVYWREHVNHNKEDCCNLRR